MENKFQVGALVSALVAPSRIMVIVNYLKRIYYCEAVEDDNHQLLAYFERELMTPVRVES